MWPKGIRRVEVLNQDAGPLSRTSSCLANSERTCLFAKVQDDSE